MARRKPVNLTTVEHSLLAEARRYVVEATGADISYGALVAILSCGVLAADRASDLSIACPNCGYGVRFTLLRGRGTSGPPGPPRASGRAEGVSAPSRP